jgi:Prokaryotic glutathione synthetase, ATP-grasp domain
MLGRIEAVRPKLIEDGMSLVGLDIVGAKLMEVNVFSPGGLGTCQTLYKVNLANEIIAALERKVASARTTRPTSTTPAWQPSDPPHSPYRTLVGLDVAPLAGWVGCDTRGSHVGPHR